MGDTTLHDILHSYCMKLPPGKSVSRLHACLTNTYRTFPDDVAFVMSQNALYENFLQEYVATQMGKSRFLSSDEPTDKEALPPIAQVVHRLGSDGARNILLALRLKRAYAKDFKWGRDYKITPAESLVFASQVAALCETNQLANVEEAYFGGILYDWLSALLKTLPNANQKLINDTCNENWEEAIRSAKIAYWLGTKLTNFKYEKEIFGAALAINSGKVILRVFFDPQQKKPTWVEIQKQIKKFRVLQTEIGLLFERAHFGISHNEVSSLCTQFFDLFRNTEAAVHYYLEPYVLRHYDKDLFRLAALLNVSSFLAAHGETLTNAWGLLEIRQRKYLAEVGIDEKSLKELVVRAQRTII